MTEILEMQKKPNYNVEADAKTPRSNKPKIFQSKWLNQRKFEENKLKD